MHPHVHCTLSLSLSAENSESLYHRLTPRMSKKCVCGGDDHLAWKRPIFLEMCTIGCYNCKTREIPIYGIRAKP